MTTLVSINRLTGKLTATLCGLLMLVMAGCGDVFVHEEFDKLVKNKSEDEVKTLIGKPTTVDANNPARVTWIYYAKTVDIDNQNKRDAKTLVIFEPEPTTHALRAVDVKYERG